MIYHNFNDNLQNHRAILPAGPGEFLFYHAEKKLCDFPHYLFSPTGFERILLNRLENRFQYNPVCVGFSGERPIYHHRDRNFTFSRDIGQTVIQSALPIITRDKQFEWVGKRDENKKWFVCPQLEANYYTLRQYLIDMPDKYVWEISENTSKTGVLVINLETKEYRKIEMPFRGRIKATCVSPDGQTAAAATATGAIIIDLE